MRIDPHICIYSRIFAHIRALSTSVRVCRICIAIPNYNVCQILQTHHNFLMTLQHTSVQSLKLKRLSECRKSDKLRLEYIFADPKLRKNIVWVKIVQIYDGGLTLAAWSNLSKVQTHPCWKHRTHMCNIAQNEFKEKILNKKNGSLPAKIWFFLLLLRK